MFKIQNIRFVFLLALLVVTALSYHPNFANAVQFEGGVNPLNRIINILAVLAAAVSFDWQVWTKNKFIRIFLLGIVVVWIEAILIDQLGYTDQLLGEARNITLAFLFLLIGYSVRISQKSFYLLLFVYSLTVAYSTYFQMVQHSGGFVITDLYIGYGKNAMGVMCASSCVALFVLAIKDGNKHIRMLSWIMFGFILLLSVGIRARSAFLAVFIILTLILYMERKEGLSMQKMSWLVFGFVVVVIIILLVPNLLRSLSGFIWDSLTENREEDLFTGRGVQNRLAIRVVSRSFWFGNMALKEEYSYMIHNYVLRQLSSYGFIGAIPVLFLYFKVVFFVIIRMFKNKVKISMVGYLAMFVLVIISMVEPTIPFAPGTSVILPFVLLGITMRNQSGIINSIKM